MTNDFTKEELNIIANGLAREIGRAAVLKKNLEDFLNLHKKIESMIDYCCDHEFKLCKNFYGVDENKYRCTQCLTTMDKLNDNGA